MDRPCDELLADAALAANQHGDIAVGYLLDDLGDGLDFGVATEEEQRLILLIVHVAAQCRDLGDELRFLDRALDRRFERDFAGAVWTVRFDDIVGRTEPDGFDDDRDLLAAGHHDDLEIRA